MNKKNIIYIVATIVMLIIIVLAISLAIALTRNKEVIKIEKYDENFNVEKTIAIKKKKEIKEIEEICSDFSLEQDEDSKYLAIRNDVKLDLENGKFFMIQLDLEEYCYYEDANSDTKLVIKMPSGLLEKVNEILAED